MGGNGSGRRPVEEMQQKLEILRQITGDKSFTIKDLPDDIYSRLGYSGQQGLFSFIHYLVIGTGGCGRQLNRIGYGQYAWANPSMGGVELEKQASPHHRAYIVRDLTPDEVTALSIIQQEILLTSQAGPIRLLPKMVAMENEEFLDFMEKMEDVKAVVNIGANGNPVGVWGLVRDKFSDFYQIAQAVRSGQYQFPPEPEATIPSESPTVFSSVSSLKTIKPSAQEKQLVALCKLAEQEVTEKNAKIEELEAKLMQLREERSEAVRRHNLFSQELKKLQTK